MTMKRRKKHLLLHHQKHILLPFLPVLLVCQVTHFLFFFHSNLKFLMLGSPRASPKLNRRRSVVERKTSSKSSSRQTRFVFSLRVLLCSDCFYLLYSPREKEEGGVTAGSPETPPSALQAKKSVHRLSVDRPRRSSSSAVVGNEGPGKTKPARTSSTTALKKSSE